MEDPWAWDWEAVGAVATAVSTAAALAFSLLAWGAPEREARRLRREATLEIIRAVEEAHRIFTDFKAVVAKGWDEKAQGLMRVQADHQSRTLAVLIQRPHITDGAIFTAAGAGALLGAMLGIEGQAELAARARAQAASQGMAGFAIRVDARSPALDALEHAEVVAQSTMNRLAAVRRYMDESFWQRRIRRLKSRFRKNADLGSAAEPITARTPGGE